MFEYRICENKYNWCKIQRRRKEIKILWMTFHGKWTDGYFHPFSTTPVRFESRKKAQSKLDEFIEQDKRLNNEWTCEKTT